MVVAVKPRSINDRRAAVAMRSRVAAACSLRRAEEYARSLVLDNSVEPFYIQYTITISNWKDPHERSRPSRPVRPLAWGSRPQRGNHSGDRCHGSYTARHVNVADSRRRCRAYAGISLI